MKPTTGLALLATALAIAAASPAAASPGRNTPDAPSARVLDAMHGLPGMRGLGSPDGPDDVKSTGNGKGNNGNGKGNDGDNIPNGKATGWWHHHGPHPVSP